MREIDRKRLGPDIVVFIGKDRAGYWYRRETTHGSITTTTGYTGLFESANAAMASAADAQRDIWSKRRREPHHANQGR